MSRDKTGVPSPMTKLRWSSPPREADPARTQRDRTARVIVTPDAERGRARALRRLRARVIDLRERHLAVQAHIARLILRSRTEVLRSKKDIGLRPVPRPNTTTVHDLRPVEAELARDLAKAWKAYRAAYRLTHNSEPPPVG